MLAVVANVCLFEADGFFPPPFTHSYVTDSVALQLTVSTEPDASPASLNWHTRFDPLSEAQIRRLLGYGTRMQVHGFLKAHGVPLDYTVEDLEQDREAHRHLGL